MRKASRNRSESVLEKASRDWSSAIKIFVGPSLKGAWPSPRPLPQAGGGADSFPLPSWRGVEGEDGAPNYSVPNIIEISCQPVSLRLVFLPAVCTHYRQCDEFPRSQSYHHARRAKHARHQTHSDS